MHFKNKYSFISICKLMEYLIHKIKNLFLFKTSKILTRLFPYSAQRFDVFHRRMVYACVHVYMCTRGIITLSSRGFHMVGLHMFMCILT